VPLPGIGVETLVVDPRRRHPHGSRRGQHVALVVVAVADHQPVTRFVNLTQVGVDVGGDLGLQRGREHLSGTVADDLVEQRPTRRAVFVG
jgi:hypothetical protein